MLTRSCTWHGTLQNQSSSQPRDGDGEVEKVECEKCKKKQGKVTTLSRHYYPEGGWGWVVVCVSVCVHLLNHGLQLSWSMVVPECAHRFQASQTETGQ